MNKLLIILLCLPLFSLGQSSPHLLRSTISNTGSSVETINKNLVQQSVGQINYLTIYPFKIIA